MENNSKIPNGGFPPIKYCEEKKINIKMEKERFFAPNNINNINIRKILLTPKKKIFINENSEEELDIVD